MVCTLITRSSHIKCLPDASATMLAIVFRAYLAEQSMDHLATALKRGNIKDLLAFFPPNRRDVKILDEHFRKENLPQVADWYTKRRHVLAKEGIMSELKELYSHEESDEAVCATRFFAPNPLFMYK